eukprot:TRINITY_DN1224_c0_g1_i8.p1 TRINITY_DN1224_c0_g1~~TRINITY_DN1224_c0_g1_i8.p1  ORF type:complete len:273 (+),score=34.51 TRINITY_DN1224_c0_g1_i8:259-1077(+)
MKFRHFAGAAAMIAVLFGAFYFLGSHHGGERSGVMSKAAWQRMSLPGELSKAHAFLEHNCSACHTAVKGVEASSCIACHANDESLLQRQPTAFHANIGSCVECHTEHREIGVRPTQMDHATLSAIGLRQLTIRDGSQTEDDRTRQHLLDWIGQHRPASYRSEGQSTLTPQEAVLNCATCHSNKDRHMKLFGQDCAQCHGTTKWTIAEFRHPSPKSMDCVQCHQAPPSHYMMHFQMISAKVAGKPHAQVDECYQCHQTTAWNDIKGVGFYKHH